MTFLSPNFSAKFLKTLNKYYATDLGIAQIKNTIDSTKKYENKFTGMCGELAADPLGIILLVGLGLDEFSVNINSVNKVKKLISLLNYEDTNKFVNELLELDSSLEIEKKLDEFAKKNFGKYY